MAEKMNPADLFNDSISLHRLFEESTEPFRMNLWRYCVSLTGSPWDGEDLFQETLTKAYGTLYQRAYCPTHLKSYVFRIATNEWINQCRKQRIPVDESHNSEEIGEIPNDSLDITLGVTLLTSVLPPRQAAALLLVDVLGFTAGEAAGMLQTTVQSIYGAIKRARKKISESQGEMKEMRIPETSPEREKMIQAYLKAMHDGDVEAVLALYSDHITNDARPGFQEFSNDEVRNGSLLHGFATMHAEECMLWGRPVIMKMADAEDGPALHDIQYQKVEDGKIVYHRSYFFCREFLSEAAKALNVPMQWNKPPVNWKRP